MDPTTPHKPLDPEHTHRPKPAFSSLPNGTLKRHQQIRPHHQQPPSSLYRECLKNHAASLGGHALDGCGEFMPSPSSNPADPTSLTCAACGCHRNFHRRLPHPLPLPQRDQQQDEEQEEEDGGEASQDDDEGGDNRHSSSPPPPSAPHMLLALSTGLSAAGGPTIAQQQVGVGAGGLPRKRFRSKFSPEQKERMQELSERLGWRMQRRDEGLVDEYCREIGVGKGVFKVWMHNNKHNFVGPTRRGEGSSNDNNATAAAGGGGGGGGGGGDSSAAHGVNGSASSS